MLFRMLAFITAFFTVMGPTLTNLFHSLLCYEGIDRHVYGLVAAGALFFILNEFDQIKRGLFLYR